MKLLKAIEKNNSERPPIWFMRQAGRYHNHYQSMKKKYSFIELCKIPEAACETTLGPMRDFGFDAAILFSDLLFPLETLGMGLKYDPSPTLDFHLKTLEDFNKLNRSSPVQLVEQLDFQREALIKIRNQLDKEGFIDEALLGFVGAPLTLFFYAAAGSHQGGNLESAISGLRDGRFEKFCTIIEPLLVQNLILQARGGANALAIFDTCGGEISFDDYKNIALPSLKRVLNDFKLHYPSLPIIYYSKKTASSHWELLRDLPISVLGIDWNTPLEHVLDRFSDRFAIQGNINPDWLLLPWQELEKNVIEVFTRVKSLPPQKRVGWICGLGHGVLQKTPEMNVKKLVELEKKFFA